MITVLCPHMGNNGLGRALVLAQLVERLGYATRVVGSVRRPDEVWAPALDAAGRIPLETFRLARHEDYPSAARALRSLLAPHEVVIVSKPLPTSMGVALLAGIRPSRCLLDIDDWELGFRLAREGSARMKGPIGVVRSIVSSLAPRPLNSEVGLWCAEALVPMYPHRTVSNHWLRERFGGQLVRHARDERALDPVRHDGRALRAELAVPDEGRTWVGFIGTPRKHKGVQVLIDAVASLRGERAPGLLLFGFDESDPVTADFARQARAQLPPERLRIKATFLLDALAQHVAAADILVVPSLSTEASVGQVPAKLFDAMAMARPVIVSDVNDMAELLGDAGCVVPPGNVLALANAIQELAHDPRRRADLGQRGRARFLARDSIDACARALAVALTPLLATPRP